MALWVRPQSSEQAGNVRWGGSSREGEHGGAWTPGAGAGMGRQVGKDGDASLDLCCPQSVLPSSPPGQSALRALNPPTTSPAQRPGEAGADAQPRPGLWAGGLPRPHGEPEVRRKPRPPGPPQLWEQMSYHSRRPSGRGDSWPNLAPVLATVARAQLQSRGHWWDPARAPRVALVQSAAHCLPQGARPC